MFRSFSILTVIFGVSFGPCFAGELHNAVRADDASALRALLKAGVNTDETDFLLGTPLHVAVSEQNEAAARLLIEHGADIEAPSELNGMRALHIASRFGDVPMISMLLERGATIDARSGSDRTALQIASQTGRLEVVKLLLERGADFDAIESVEGLSALAIACFQGNLEIARALLEAGADVEATTSNGRSVVFLASSIASYSNVGGDELIRLLLNLGADIDLPDDAGITPLSYANRRNTKIYREIAASLRELGAKE